MRFFQAFADAFRGIGKMITHDRNFKWHLLALIITVSAGIYFSITRGEWLTIILTSVIVLSLEAINTAIEQLCDEVTLERKESIRNIKDIAAGAVLIAAIGALVVAGVVFGPYVATLLNE